MATDDKWVNTGMDYARQKGAAEITKGEQEKRRSQASKVGNGAHSAVKSGGRNKGLFLETVSLGPEEFAQRDGIMKGKTPDDFELVIGQSYELRPGPPISGPVRVEIALPVMVELVKYAVGDLEYEQGGFLLGSCREVDGLGVVAVTAWVEAKYATHRQTSLTFTHRDWDYLATEHERLYPGLRVVGWFHTHPGFGVFLSSYDLFIHYHFFATPDQIALVIDPLRKKAGVFIWNKGEVVEGDFRIVDGERIVNGKTRGGLNETGEALLGESCSVDSIQKIKDSDTERPEKRR